MSLTFRQLEIIRAVSRSGSVTGAAASLGISQPAISIALRDCKAEAGFPLFVRRQGRLQPTSETGILLADLDRVFDGMDRIHRLVDDLATATVGTLHIAATPTLADNLVPLAVAMFGRERPNVRITVQAMDNFAVVRQVDGSLVDFGLALSPLTRFEGGFQDVCASELICAVHPEHPLARRRCVGPADVEPYPLISFSRSLPLGALVEQSFQAAGLRRRIAVEVNQSSVACAMARAGVGIAVIDPFWGLGSSDTGIARVPFRPAIEIRAQLLEPPGRPLSRLARLFLEGLRQASRSLIPAG